MSCNNYSNGTSNQCFIRHLTEYIGETVICFTASGGISGSGFTGVLAAVNADYIRLVTQQSTSPTCPFNHSPCNDLGSNNTNGDYDNFNTSGRNCRRNNSNYNVGSVCDIPISQICAFCHNAV